MVISKRKKEAEKQIDCISAGRGLQPFLGVKVEYIKGSQGDRESQTVVQWWCTHP